jgi:hypothetical protein
MAEKEERITIHKVLYPCEKCSINCNKNDWKDCDFYQNYISGITRADAIECMAKEIARQYDPRKPNKEEYERIWEHELFPATKKYYLEQGESVLNALLEGNK